MLRVNKPHFRIKAKVWSCASIVKDGFVIGFGYTVNEAWSDWQRNMVKERVRVRT